MSKHKIGNPTDGCGDKPEYVETGCHVKSRMSQSQRFAQLRGSIDLLRALGVREGLLSLLRDVGMGDVAMECQDDRTTMSEEWWAKGAEIIRRSESILRNHLYCYIDPSSHNAKPSESILTEAARIRSGERNADYGDAVESFEKIARVAGEMTGLTLSATDCCKVMMAVKLIRESYNHKRDNLVDLCGYSDILELIEERKQVER